MKKRILSVAPLAPFVLFAVYYGSWPFALMVGAAACVAVYEWYRLCQNGDNFFGNLLMGLVYVLICFGAFAYLRYETLNGEWLALAVILAVWASDIGAYFTGKLVGGPKLAPVISPKKTWAGFFGAVFFSGLTFWLLLFFPPFADSFSRYWLVVVTGFLLGAAGQAGDLFVSFMKRRVGLKDTGALFPGHGGLLDRIDSLMLVSPVFLCIVLLWLK